MRFFRKKLFGTDGIRGKAGKYPIYPHIVLRVGQALGILLKKKYPKETHHIVLIGKDTRLSGYMLEQALASGLNSVGVWVQLTGPLPTPGISFLAQNMRVSAGVVISASHNPYYDNGIKIFLADGFKISLSDEKQIENFVLSTSQDINSTEFFNKASLYISSKAMGRTKRIVDATGRYIVFAKNSFPKKQDLKGLKIVLDCANGAAYKVAPAIFTELGAEVLTQANHPNGFNINKQVGALYPKKMANAVLKEKADVGISLDGDGDRLIMADEKGRILNGDHILGICALYLKNQRQLKKIVTTIVSNSGLTESLKSYGITCFTSEIGDRSVVDLMREKNISLGGEPSGHIIFLKNTTTGDACIAALNVLAAMKQSKRKLSFLRDQIKQNPQIQLTIPVKEKIPLESIPGYLNMIASIKKSVKTEGRLLVRYSGTENLIRVFMEGKSISLIKGQVNKIQTFFKSKLS